MELIKEAFQLSKSRFDSLEGDHKSQKSETERLREVSTCIISRKCLPLLVVTSFLPIPFYKRSHYHDIDHYICYCMQYQFPYHRLRASVIEGGHGGSLHTYSEFRGQTQTNKWCISVEIRKS